MANEKLTAYPGRSDFLDSTEGFSSYRKVVSVRISTSNCINQEPKENNSLFKQLYLNGKNKTYS